MARPAAFGRPALIVDENLRLDGNNVADGVDNENSLLELSFCNVQFVTSVLESLQFMPMETRRQKSCLLLRSAGSHIPSGLDIAAEADLLTELFAELESFPLTSIRIDRFAFDMPVRPLARFVRQTASTLQHLTLLNCSFLGVQDDGAAFEELCTAARGLRHLQTFVLKQPQSEAGNDFGVLRNRCSRLIGCVAPHVRSLSLDISNIIKEINGPHFNAWMVVRGVNNQRQAVYGREQVFTTGFGTLLGSINTVERLSLAICDMRSLLPIATALKQNRSIKILECKAHFWEVFTATETTELVQAILEMIEDNFVLQRIHMVSTVGGDTEFAELPCVDNPLIAFYLKVNGAGRYHLLESGQATRREWIETIVDNRDDTKVVQFFLSKNPSLCVAV